MPWPADCGLRQPAGPRPSLSDSVSSSLVARNAGMVPNSSAVASVIADGEEQHARVERDIERDGFRPLETMRSSRRLAACGESHAERAAGRASIRLSVSNWRTRRMRCAPSACRTANSRAPRRRARQQQVGDIGARDQQHQRRRCPSEPSTDRRIGGADRRSPLAIDVSGTCALFRVC